jgi:hypothetical protein
MWVHIHVLLDVFQELSKSNKINTIKKNLPFITNYLSESVGPSFGESKCVYLGTTFKYIRTTMK